MTQERKKANPFQLDETFAYWNREYYDPQHHQFRKRSDKEMWEKHPSARIYSGRFLNDSKFG